MSGTEPEAVSVKSAFGAENRNRLIDEYFGARRDVEPTAAAAWSHVYRLLLWIDRTTGLAHCYESDKCQPGKPWYARSLAFHDWASTAFDTAPADLAAQIDWLFLRVTKDLAAEVLQSEKRRAQQAAEQRAPYAGRGFPAPGEDPELVNILRNVLGQRVIVNPAPETWERLVQQVRQYVTLDNKRKNLVGEGFEDVLAQVIRRVCTDTRLHVSARKLLHELPGFARTKAGEKPNKVDVAVIRPGMRTIVTAKWSVRADREKQFPADFNEYVAAESDGKPFEYVLVTNEFDPARLMRACQKLVANSPMFKHVVHINTEAIVATYSQRKNDSMERVVECVKDGRLISLEKWLSLLQSSN